MAKCCCDCDDENDERTRTTMRTMMMIRRSMRGELEIVSFFYIYSQRFPLLMRW